MNIIGVEASTVSNTTKQILPGVNVAKRRGSIGQPLFIDLIDGEVERTKDCLGSSYSRSSFKGCVGDGGHSEVSISDRSSSSMALVRSG